MDKNGISGLSNINGIGSNSNKNVYSQTTSLAGNSSRGFIRNSQPQQYHSYQPSHQQQPSSAPFQLPSEMRRIDDNLITIRLPRGPDGTNGFIFKR